MTPEQELEETYRQIARLIEETEQRLERMPGNVAGRWRWRWPLESRLKRA